MNVPLCLSILPSLKTEFGRSIYYILTLAVNVTAVERYLVENSRCLVHNV